MEFNSILIATDFSDCSGAAFQAAQTLAKRFESKLILLHVIDQNFIGKLVRHMGRKPETLLKRLRTQAEQEIKDFLQKWNAKDLPVDTIIATGLPFQEIAVKARELAVDLVVVGGFGRRGRQQIDEVFFGSTAEKVVRLLPCPILCIPLGLGPSS
ncbi:MAG: universal stress protein [Desulfobacteraceae bacterium]